MGAGDHTSVAQYVVKNIKLIRLRDMKGKWCGWGKITVYQYSEVYTKRSCTCTVQYSSSKPHITIEHLKNAEFGASLAVQWLRMRLAVQGVLVWSLVWADPKCLRATKPVRLNR